MDGRGSGPIERTADDILSMRVRGAGRIGRAASRALGELAYGHVSGDLSADLREAASTLLSTRPTAVSLRNAIVLTLSGMVSLDGPELREDVIWRSGDFITRSRDSVESIGREGAVLIPDNATVLTHCNSSAALSAIYEGFKLGKVRRVINTETRPWRQGHITSRWLAGNGVPVTMIVDSAVNHLMKDVDIVMVGADTITRCGDLINKIGTSQIALSAGENSVPFHACAETYKFSPTACAGADVPIEDRGPKEVADPLRVEDMEGVRFENPIFDVTPGRFIDSIVTERGPILPEEAG
ncbi:MAG: S-methyl-5-thioribose-1-phosphate isomerase, partial [Thermoplasmata archaeon]|nr:S-methyl-5-thioribose-1-phosphate isomerase [Thermoplasmata archaeon]